MISDFFLGLLQGFVDMLPTLPDPPAWWPSSGPTIPLFGLVSASVLTAVIVFYVGVLIGVPAVKAVRRGISHFTGGGGAL